MLLRTNRSIEDQIDINAPKRNLPFTTPIIGVLRKRLKNRLLARYARLSYAKSFER